MDNKGQGAFEYLLLIGGAVLFVIIAVAVIRTAINTNTNAANNTAGGYQLFVNRTTASVTCNAGSGCSTGS